MLARVGRRFRKLEFGKMTFFKRELPQTCIDLNTDKGQAIFCKALQQGNMRAFFPLISVFQTQSEPAYCGLASLAMVLNSLNLDPRRVWKGVWRWFSEELLDCCVPLATVRETGVSFDELSCLAVCNGAKINSFRPDKSLWVTSGCANADSPPPAEFASFVATLREHIRTSAKEKDHHRLIVSYDRSVLGQTGVGHFTPVGGYDEDSDQVLLLDVARFKYPPHFVPVRLLAEAMCSIDETSGKSRGYLVVDVSPATAPPPAVQVAQWQVLLHTATEAVRSVAAPSSAAAVVSALLKSVPPNTVSELREVYNNAASAVKAASCCAEGNVEQLVEAAQLMRAVRSTALFAFVQTLTDDAANPFFSFLALVLKDVLLNNVGDAAVRDELRSLLEVEDGNSVLAHEVARCRKYLSLVDLSETKGGCNGTCMQ